MCVRVCVFYLIFSYFHQEHKLNAISTMLFWLSRKSKWQKEQAIISHFTLLYYGVYVW